MNREPNDAPSALRRKNLRDLLDDHIRTHGEFTDAELAEARGALYGVEDATTLAPEVDSAVPRQALRDFLDLADQVSIAAVGSEADAAGAADPIAVTATAWKRGWELHIEGVGITQSASMEDAEATVRNYLEIDGLDRDAPLDITFEIR